MTPEHEEEQSLIRSMTSRNAVAAALISLVVAATCASCADTSSGTEPVANEVVRDIPDSWQGPAPDFLTGEPVAGWVGDDRFGIVTMGSSSCPPVAVEVQTVDPQTIRVVFEPSPNDPCTADMAATTHIFAVPDDIRERPIDLLVDFSGHEDLSFRLDE